MHNSLKRDTVIELFFPDSITPSRSALKRCSTSPRRQSSSPENFSPHSPSPSTKQLQQEQESITVGPAFPTQPHQTQLSTLELASLNRLMFQTMSAGSRANAGYQFGACLPPFMPKIELPDPFTTNFLQCQHPVAIGATLSETESDLSARKKKRARIAFTNEQVVELERRFHQRHYLSSTERTDLARSLDLSETQVRTITFIF